MADVVLLKGVRCAIDTCITCGVIFSVPEAKYDHAQAEGGYFTCSNGHSQGWDKNGCERERLRRERDRLTQRLAQKDDEIKAQRELREAAERQAAAARGQVTKIKNRVGHGVCPCCNRTFENLARHINSKHPTFVAEAAE